MGFLLLSQSLALADDPAPGRPIRATRIGDLEELWVQPATDWGCAAFSPDGRHLAVGNASGLIGVWDSATARRELEFRAHVSSVLALAWSPDGRVIASSGKSGGTRLHEARTGDEIDHLTRERHAVKSLSFSGDGRTVIISSEAGPEYWERAATATTSGVVLGQYAIPFEVVGGSRPFPILMWDVARDVPLPGLLVLPRRPDALAESFDGALVAAAIGGEPLRIWEASSGRCVLKTERIAECLRVLDFSPDHRFLWGLGVQGGLRIWDVRDGRVVLQCDTGEWGSPISLAWLSQDVVLMTVSKEARPTLWRLELPDRPEPLPLSPEEWEKAWEGLGGADAGVAHRALWRLADSPEVACRFLEWRLRGPGLDLGWIRGRIAGLDDDDVAVREEATGQLMRCPRDVYPVLSHALVSSPSPEAKERLHAILERFAVTYPIRHGEFLLALRAVMALERMGTEDARKLLTSLAPGGDDGLIALHAHAALDRLSRR